MRGVPEQKRWPEAGRPKPPAVSGVVSGSPRSLAAANIAQPQQPGSEQGQRSRLGNGRLKGLVDIAEPGVAEKGADIDVLHDVQMVVGAVERDVIGGIGRRLQHAAGVGTRTLEIEEAHHHAVVVHGLRHLGDGIAEPVKGAGAGVERHADLADAGGGGDGVAEQEVAVGGQAAGIPASMELDSVAELVDVDFAAAAWGREADAAAGGATGEVAERQRPFGEGVGRGDRARRSGASRGNGADQSRRRQPRVSFHDTLLKVDTRAAKATLAPASRFNDLAVSSYEECKILRHGTRPFAVSAPRVRPGWDALQPSLGLSLRGAFRSPAYGPRPGSPVGRASHLGKRRSQVSSAVEDAVDRHLLGADVEGNGNPHLEADHAQPGPDVVASGAPLRKVASRRQAAWMRST